MAAAVEIRIVEEVVEEEQQQQQEQEVKVSNDEDEATAAKEEEQNNATAAKDEENEEQNNESTVSKKRSVDVLEHDIDDEDNNDDDGFMNLGKTVLEWISSPGKVVNTLGSLFNNFLGTSTSSTPAEPEEGPPALDGIISMMMLSPLNDTGSVGTSLLQTALLEEVTQSDSEQQQHNNQTTKQKQNKTNTLTFPQ